MSSLYILKGTAVIGTVFEAVDGWRFGTNTSSHRSGRKGHDTPEQAIPKWASKIATEVITSEEWKARNKGS